MVYEIRDEVDDGVKGKELRASNRLGHLQLTKSDLNRGEAGWTVDTLDGAGGSHRIVEEERLGLHADPNKERAERLLLPSVGEGDRAN